MVYLILNFSAIKSMLCRSVKGSAVYRGQKSVKEMKKEVRLYNIILPIWLLVWIPSWLWLLLIPINWLVDWLVTRYALKRLGDEGYASRSLKLSWKICIAGFVSDFAGALLLLGALYLCSVLGGNFSPIEQGLGWNPFTNVFSVLLLMAAIALSGFCVYQFDRRILGKENLTPEQVHKTALALAVITAPYLYLLPASLFY